ncbi:cyclin-like protein [Delphinella strobiligena]|nr:cyclin-like protein [Delphinella strobiligena]
MAAQHLIEDDVYRTSTQYRLWSFSPEALASLRHNTHSAAIERAKQYLPNSDPSIFLTLDEEVRLTQRYCDTISSTVAHLKWPSHVKATAIQYLKRFYLTNSVHTYPPKETYKSVIFLASKTEGVHMTLGDFASKISSKPEQILAPEYKIIQALRFTLDVRQPIRGLRGCYMELENLAHGKIQEMGALPPLPQHNLLEWTPANQNGQVDAKGLQERSWAAYSAARTLLDDAALLTDAYFLYTPPQIYLAALKLADEPLYSFYMSLHLSSQNSMHGQIMATISGCADLMGNFNKSQIMSKDERVSVERRLEEVRDPSTMDLVKRHEEAKRGGGEEGVLDEQQANKRRLARESSMREGEDLFGPSLSQPLGSAG